MYVGASGTNGTIAPPVKPSPKARLAAKQIYEEGRKRYKSGEYCRTIALSEQLLRLPDLPREYGLQARFNIGSSLLHLRRYPAAKAVLEKLLSEPDLPSAGRTRVEDRLAEIACLAPVRQGISGLGSTRAAGTPAAVRHFTCAEAIRATLSQAAGRDLSMAELRQSLEQAVRLTTEAIARAVADLARSARGPQAVSAFQDAFGLLPTFVPSWRPAGQRWDLGDVVHRRLQRAREILAGGSIRFVCTNETSVSSGAPGRYTIALGPHFWQWVHEGKSNGMIWALLSPALRIYFGPRLQHQAVGVRRERIPCYGYFVLSRAGLPLGDTRGFCTGDGSSPTPAPTPAAGAPQSSGGAPAPKIDLFPQEVFERVVGPPPSSLDLAIDQAIREAESGSRPQLSRTTQTKLGFGSLFDRVLERTRIPASLRPLARKLTQAAAEKGSELLFDRGMDELGIRGEAREAIRAVLEGLWHRAR
ncbi:MAG: hypothetical protein L0170_13370 [Acidobacteria bacterium]|nr:hypothetical protein [Acidobacteriota bacterium]